MGKITEKIANSKREERQRLVFEAVILLGLAADHPEDDQYLNATAEDIVANLKARKDGWTCERVMQAFIRAACAAHHKTNCLTEVFFTEALQQARDKDAELASTGMAEGAFWGLPSSFKDTYNVVGVDTSLGCSPHCFKPTEKPEDEASLVKLFRHAGGIPFCKTNVPQTLLAFECANPIFGTTTNPYTSTRGPGGSSGGEAALVTLHGTPVGWGSDIGGSLRIPAAYSGCCGLKPAIGRWPLGGDRPVTPGFEGIKVTVGPMARNVGDLTFAAHTMIDLIVKGVEERKLDTVNVVPIPWREPQLPSRLKIGYWIHDDLVKTSPAVVRAVNETAQALRKEGHELVEFKPPPIHEALKIFVALTSADAYKTLLSNIGPDPKEPSMELVTIGPRLPFFVRWLATTLIHYAAKDEKFADILSQSCTKSAGAFWHWTDRRNKFTEEFRKAAWEDNNFDFLLCPVQAVPALEHNRTKNLSPLSVGTVLFNVVDSTVGVLPVTHVDKERDVAPKDYCGEETDGSWILERGVYGTDNPAYDAEKMHGLPVAVQIVGRAFDEEKVLAMMKIVEDAVGYTGVKRDAPYDGFERPKGAPEGKAKGDPAEAPTA